MLAAFLAVWQVAEKGYEDAMHAVLVDWAVREQQRLDHLRAGDRKAADRVAETLRRTAADF